MKVYGASICGDCVRAKSILEKEKVKHQYIDITASTANMKEFLKLRDSRKEYDEIKEYGLIGIPSFVFEDGSIEFDIDLLDRKKANDDKLGDDGHLPAGMCGLGGC